MQEYYQNFYKTLVLNVATISAIIVGVVTFAVRSFNENNGSDKVRNLTLTVLEFIDKIIAQITSKLDTDVPVVEVAQTRLQKR